MSDVDWRGRAERAEAEVTRLTTVLQAIAAAGICSSSGEIAKDALKRAPALFTSDEGKKT